MKLKRKKLKGGKDGFVAIESVFAMSFFLILFLMMIGFFLLIHPQTLLGREVHALATLAERQGGLTAENIGSFQNRVGDYGFVGDGSIVVSVLTESGADASNVDLESAGIPDPYYIERSSGDLIHVHVTVPHDNPILESSAAFFGVDDLVKEFQFKEVVYSERY